MKTNHKRSEQTQKSTHSEGETKYSTFNTCEEIRVFLEGLRQSKAWTEAQRHLDENQTV